MDEVYGLVYNLEEAIASLPEEAKIRARKRHEFMRSFLDQYVFDVDISDALIMEFDGAALKVSDEFTFDCLLILRLCCQSKFGLRFFTPPTVTRSTRKYGVFDGGALKSAWRRLTNTKWDNFFEDKCFSHATAAVAEYNKKLGKEKLKFVRLVSGTKTLNRTVLYVTFSALDLETQEHDIYQTAGTDIKGVYQFGLLKKQSSDKFLAIVSVTGVDEELEAKRVFLASFPVQGS